MQATDSGSWLNSMIRSAAVTVRGSGLGATAEVVFAARVYGIGMVLGSLAGGPPLGRLGQQRQHGG